MDRGVLKKFKRELSKKNKCDFFLKIFRSSAGKWNMWVLLPVAFMGTAFWRREAPCLSPLPCVLFMDKI